MLVVHSPVIADDKQTIGGVLGEVGLHVRVHCAPVECLPHLHVVEAELGLGLDENKERLGVRASKFRSLDSAQ